MFFIVKKHFIFSFFDVFDHFFHFLFFENFDLFFSFLFSFFRVCDFSLKRVPVGFGRISNFLNLLNFLNLFNPCADFFVFCVFHCRDEAPIITLMSSSLYFDLSQCTSDLHS